MSNEVAGISHSSRSDGASRWPRHTGRVATVWSMLVWVAMAWVAMAWVAGAGTASLFADTLIFDSADMVDTWIAGADPTAAHGDDPGLEWDGADNGGVNYALLRVDNLFGAGQIQPGDVITSATLSYNVTNSGGIAAVHPVTVPWSESVTFDTFGSEAGVQAADYGAVAAAAPGATGMQSVDVTVSLLNWQVDPSSALGWIFISGSSNGVVLDSSEASNSGDRPLLTVVVNEGAPPGPLVTRGPYLQQLTSESVVVRWRSNVPSNSRVILGSVPGGNDSQIDVADVVTEHEIVISGLNPREQYFYQVGSSAGVSAGGDADHFFWTAPSPGSDQPVRIWAIGDFGSADGPQADVRDAYYNFAGSTYTDVWLFLGDNAYDDGTDVEYQAAVFDMYNDLLRQSAFWSTRGNHESSATVHYGLCTNPTNGEAGGLASGTESYYSFDYGNIHFVCLDSQGSDRSVGGAMLTWLQSDLAATTRDWIIAYWHHPPYTKGTHDSDDDTDSGGRMRDMRENALPILEAAGVDLVLGGHSHVYERSFLLDGHYGDSATLQPATMILDSGDGDPVGSGAYEKGTAGNDGAVYIVMGSSGRLGSGSLDHPAMFHSVELRGSVVIDVASDVMNVLMLRDNGATEDLFQVTKDLGDPQFRRGDTNDDSSENVTDVVHLLGYLFIPGTPVVCLDSLDVNDDGNVALVDAIALLNYLFLQGPVPAPPALGCGADPTADTLTCAPGNCP